MLMEDWIACGLLSGGLILSTCNRVEIYYDAPSEAPEATERRLIKSFLSNLELSQRYAQYLSTLRDEAVYRHLFRLSAGLESLVVGETQILGQIKASYRMASIAGHCTGSLSRLFHRAFEVAKRIRHSYFLSSTPRSAGSAAVDYLLEYLPTPRKLLIVGAGQIADTAYEHLLRRGQEPQSIIIYNRTRERAERFAEAHPGARVACEGELNGLLSSADAIIVATSAPSPIVQPHHLPDTQGKRIVIDLAVPRNVAVEVGNLPYVQLLSIDELGGLDTQLSAEDLAGIHQLIEEYVHAHRQWVAAAPIREVISEVQEASERLLAYEIEHLPTSLSPEERQLIVRWNEHFRTTYTTAIVAALRELSEEGAVRKYSEAIRQIFTAIKDKHLCTN